ncbi:MAG: DUF1802 family protein [Thermoleophilia bacterium]
MAEHALKEWAVTIEALCRGHQVMIVRKGGIGEKRFTLPHPRFYLFPGYLHQRPDLVAERWRPVFDGTLARREDPEMLPLTAYAELHSSHPISDPGALALLGPEHILTDDYAAERLRWRRKHPLWAVVLRVWRVEEPPVLATGPEHGGCVSWVDLPDSIRAPRALVPALPDDDFAAAAERIESILATGAAH